MTVARFFPRSLTLKKYRFVFFAGDGIKVFETELENYETIKAQLGGEDGFVENDGILFEFSRDQFRPGTVCLGAAFAEVV